MKTFMILTLAFLSGCASKTICSNGGESYRPIFDPDNSCKVRIRKVIVGSDIKIPQSAALDGGVNWSYDWVDSEFKNGRIELGHLVLVPQSGGAKNE